MHCRWRGIRHLLTTPRQAVVHWQPGNRPAPVGALLANDLSGRQGDPMNSREGACRPRTTIYNVAHQAGVSIKTVSRVVNQEANVREATRRRVQAVIQALDYRPNAHAQYLGGLGAGMPPSAGEQR